jgi:integrase
MATIRKLSSGRFQAIINAPGHPRVSRSFASRQSAEVWVQYQLRAMEAISAEVSPVAPSMPLRAALRKYQREVTPQKKGARAESRRIDIWCEHPLAVRALNDIRGADLAEHRNARRSMGVTPDTVRLELAVISHLYEVARTDWGLEELVNPKKAMRRVRHGRPRDRRLNSGEFDALLARCAVTGNHRLKVAIILAVETAMRRGEMVGLLWENVDLDQQLAYLPDTKNDESRTVPLSSRAVAALKELGEPRIGRVFDVHPDNVTKRFHQACEKCGIAGLRFHDLRHEATSRLFEKGFNMVETATVTGHKSMQMLKRYTHLDPRSLLGRLG